MEALAPQLCRMQSKLTSSRRVFNSESLNKGKSRQSSSYTSIADFFCSNNMNHGAFNSNVAHTLALAFETATDWSKERKSLYERSSVESLCAIACAWCECWWCCTKRNQVLFRKNPDNNAAASLRNVINLLWMLQQQTNSDDNLLRFGMQDANRVISWHLQVYKSESACTKITNAQRENLWLLRFFHSTTIITIILLYNTKLQFYCNFFFRFDIQQKKNISEDQSILFFFFTY